jgi:hypothetical protein|tara:strand:+ start:61 stop:879 length:819 start_codon:yes stop_codon:yes gene_type:complete
MSAEAPGAVRKGYYDLPEVPGVPDLASDAMLAIMASAGPAEAEVLRQQWLRLGVEEGDDAAINETVMDTLCSNEELVAEGLRIFLGEDIPRLCEERGWSQEPFLRCKCSLNCFAELARTDSGHRVLDSVTSRLHAAHERPTLPKKRRRQGTESDESTWLKPVEGITPEVLVRFLETRQQVQLAVASELIHKHSCCYKATLACINHAKTWSARKRKRGRGKGSRAEAAGIVCRAVPRPAGCRVPRARCAAVGSRESRCAHMWLLYALCIRTLM